MSLFLLQLRGELWKLFARKRTYLGFGVFLGVETLILFLWQLPGGQRWMRRLICCDDAPTPLRRSITVASSLMRVNLPSRTMKRSRNVLTKSNIEHTR